MNSSVPHALSLLTASFTLRSTHSLMRNCRRRRAHLLDTVVLLTGCGDSLAGTIHELPARDQGCGTKHGVRRRHIMADEKQALGLVDIEVSSRLRPSRRPASRTLPRLRRRAACVGNLEASNDRAAGTERIVGHRDVGGLRTVVGSLRQSCLAQALSEADSVLRPPERRRYPVKIAKPQRGIDLAQAGHRRPRFDHPIRKSIGNCRHPQCGGPVRLLVEGLGRPGYRLVVTTSKSMREGHAG